MFLTKFCTPPGRYHRRAVVELLRDGTKELEFTSKVFEVTQI